MYFYGAYEKIQLVRAYFVRERLPKMTRAPCWL